LQEAAIVKQTASPTKAIKVFFIKSNYLKKQIPNLKSVLERRNTEGGCLAPQI
jgi:hypothetical protein